MLPAVGWKTYNFVHKALGLQVTEVQMILVKLSHRRAVTLDGVRLLGAYVGLRWINATVLQWQGHGSAVAVKPNNLNQTELLFSSHRSRNR